MKKIIFSLFAMTALFASCSDDDDNTSIPVQTADFTVTIENVLTPVPYFQGGLAAIPEGATEPGPILPGDVYEFTVQAGPNVLPMDGGTRLNFLTMFVQSNDLFLAPSGEGIALYDDNGNPVTGDVTDQVQLWDAGTEVNEITGSDSQKPQQDPDASDIGTDEDGVVTLITGNTDGVNDLPDVADVIQVTLSNEGTLFTVRIENVSNSTTIATPALGAGTTAAVPMSPFVYVVHTAPNPFFETGQRASEGVEDIAEDGFAAVESERVGENTGLIIPFSPGVWAVHDAGTNPLYISGSPDFGNGLEGIAEDGTPGTLATSLATEDFVSSSDLFNTPDGAAEPGPLTPGSSYSFNITASPGDNLSFATMSIQSNDWFYTFTDTGLELFNGDIPISGDVTPSVLLYDAGTEADEFPGAGLNQVIRQSALNTGPVDPDNLVREIETPIGNVPSVANTIRVTITPN